MPKDFAKQKLIATRPEKGLPRGILFFAGFLLGFFVCFLGALWYFIPVTDITSTKADLSPAKPEIKADEMQWDFYEIFPRSVVPVVQEYDETGDKISVDQFSWVIQAGSFLELKDADKMRGELILLGLDVFITTVKVSNQDHHRVLVGPFDSELTRNRAQDKLAQAQIASMPLKIPK